MSREAGQTADEWLPPELAPAQTVEPGDHDEEPGDGLSDPVEPSPSSTGAGIERMLERADRVQSALRKVEARVEEGDERGRLAAGADAALLRAEAAEAEAREAAAVADRFAAEVAALADLVVAQEVELEDLREQAFARARTGP